MGDAASVADDKEILVSGLELAVHLDFHIIELDLDAVQKGILVGGAGRDLVQRIDHLDDPVQNPLGKDKAEVAGGRVEGRGDEGLFDPALGLTAAAHKVAEPLNDDTAAQHIAQAGDAFAVAVGVLERLGEMLGD